MTSTPPEIDITSTSHQPPSNFKSAAAPGFSAAAHASRAASSVSAGAGRTNFAGSGFTRCGTAAGGAAPSSGSESFPSKSSSYLTTTPENSVLPHLASRSWSTTSPAYHDPNIPSSACFTSTRVPSGHAATTRSYSAAPADSSSAFFFPFGAAHFPAHLPAAHFHPGRSSSTATVYTASSSAAAVSSRTVIIGAGAPFDAPGDGGGGAVTSAGGAAEAGAARAVAVASLR